MGGLSVLPDAISTEASLLEWIKRLSSLFKPSKTHTMKSQTREIMQMDGHNFYDYTWQISSNEWDVLYMLEDRKDKLEQISQWMIQKNMASID